MIKLKQLVEAINEATEKANQSLTNCEDKILNDFFDKDEETNNYSAKTITIDYPMADVDGKIENIEIDVPLITMMPITTSAIEELKFTTNLDITLEKDELMVSFAPRSVADKESTVNKDRTTALLEIVIKPHENAEGLSQLIEGYEKALRSKIPS